MKLVGNFEMTDSGLVEHGLGIVGRGRTVPIEIDVDEWGSGFFRFGCTLCCLLSRFVTRLLLLLRRCIAIKTIGDNALRSLPGKFTLDRP